MIHVGADLHQRFCYFTALDARGRQLRAGAVANQPEALRKWLRQLPGEVEVAVEACSFWPGFREAIEDEVAELRLVHPQRVKAIASAKLKNDKVDSATLAHLLRCDLLPEAWMADPATRELRQQVRLRATLVRQRTRLKNQVHAILHQQGLRPGVTDLFGRQGRSWLRTAKLPPQARLAVDTFCALIDQFSGFVSQQDRGLRQRLKQEPRARLLTTIPGIGLYSALLLLAEIGDITRFPHKHALASYAGLVPWVRESAGHTARGSITRCGSTWLRWIMVEAACTAVRTSPAIRAWYTRLARRKHRHVARVALARKLLVAVWALLKYGKAFDESVFAAM